MDSTLVAPGDVARRDALVARLFEAAIGTLDLLTVYLGDRLGLYEVLTQGGPCTSAELADRAGIAERYAREWLEQQAVTGLLDVAQPEPDAAARRYVLPAAHAEVLRDPESLNGLAPLVRIVVGVSRPLEEVIAAMRPGTGVPFPVYGADLREGIGENNRRMFDQQLGPDWLPALPDVHARLQRAGGRIVDVGCGVGWSSIALARAYPLAQVVGLDLDDASIETGRTQARAAGVADRVTFVVGDAADPDVLAAGPYTLATAFETIHDMARPDLALAALRRLVGDDGSVLVADERVAERFEAPGDDVERLNYGFSVLHCLPSSLIEPGSLGLGTVFRPATLQRLASDAGFARTTTLPIEHDFFRFYRLDAR